MYKSLYTIFFYTFILVSCQTQEASSDIQAVQSSQPQEIMTNATEAIVSSHELIRGRWVSEKDPDTGFEPWAFFDKEKVYSDGNEEGTPYQLKEDQIIYDSVNGKTITRVIELTASRFVEESEGGFRTVWKKEDR